MMADVNRGLKNWASQVKMYGFSHIWLTQHVTNLENCHIVFKQRVIDEFIQNWHVHIDNSKSLRPILYKNLREHFLPELYINVLPLKLRTVITKMRISAHQLRIETGRYARNHIERHNHTLCNTIDIEDEYHFFFICPIYSHLRKRYLLPYFYKKKLVCINYVCY